MCVCIALCTIVAHNTAQNRPDNFPSYHCSDDVYMREWGQHSSKKCLLKLQAKDVLPNTNHTQAAKRAEQFRFCPRWPWPLTFKLVQVRDQTCLPCEFGMGPEIFHTWTKKPQTNGTKNRSLCSSLRVVKSQTVPITELYAVHCVQ